MINSPSDLSWRELAAKLFCIGFFAIAVYFLLEYAFSALLPFIIAYLVYLIIDPVSRVTSHLTKLPRKLCAAVYVTLGLIVLFFVGALCAERLLSEAQELLSREKGSSVFGEALATVSGMLEKFNISDGGVSDKLYAIFAGLEESAVSYIASTVGRIVSGAVSRAPSFFIGGVVTVTSCYYFCIDGEALAEKIKKAIPLRYRKRASVIAALAGKTIKRYLRAYLLLMLITFFEVLVGLSVLRVKYALLIALVIAVVDIMPILGAGTVLVPWALICFAGGDVRMGLGLIILYGIVTVVRQIAEPAVIGSSIGIHPALSLISVYLGFKLFGIAGMIVCPSALFVLSETIKKGSE